MDNIFHSLSKVQVILLVLFSCGLLIAAGDVVVRALQGRPGLVTNGAPPNGTPGSAQPGTIGLARPHAPIQVQ
jgi:hypothetical protein